MNGYKYLVVTTVSIVAVVLCFIVVLGQFNQMVYPAHITALSLNTAEKGVCQIEFLGEKAQLAMPDLELKNTYQTLKKDGRLAVMQLWETRLKVLLQEVNFGQFLNTFEMKGLLSSKSGDKETPTGVRN